jgi:hypothetical protein
MSDGACGVDIQTRRAESYALLAIGTDLENRGTTVSAGWKPALRFGQRGAIHPTLMIRMYNSRRNLSNQLEGSS